MPLLIEMPHPCLSENPQVFFNFCRPIDIDVHVPLKYAIPLYGYVIPTVVAATLATNTFIVFVLAHKSLRTPTNYVLLTMAIAELLTGLSSTPWFVYYYTMKGHETAKSTGLPAFWCTVFPHFSVTLPTIFHTAAIWLTCYLAFQRYIYVVKNLRRRQLPNFGAARRAIAWICATAVVVTLPTAFASYNIPYTLTQNATWVPARKEVCVRQFYPWILKLNVHTFYVVVFWLQALFLYSIPCILCAFLTFLLVRTMRKQERRRRLLNKTPQNGAPKRGRKGSQHTKMLIAIVCLFLVTEVPAALIFTLHLLTVTKAISLDTEDYRIINTAIVFRNVLIMVSYPFRFAIYCGMSEQFRQVAKARFGLAQLDSARVSLSNFLTNSTAPMRSSLLTEESMMRRLSSFRANRSFRVPSDNNVLYRSSSIREEEKEEEEEETEVFL